MAIISSNKLKAVVLILITVLIYTGWSRGIEVVYARILLFGTNATLSIVKNDSSIELEKADKTYQFKVRTTIDGRKASFPQVFGSLLQPFVIILSWQIFLFFGLNRKSALYSLGLNMGIYYLIQVFFLILLTGYHTSEVQKFIYVLLMDSFYIIGLVLVIKDNMLYPVFRKP